jgi:hypothetical protein
VVGAGAGGFVAAVGRAGAAALLVGAAGFASGGGLSFFSGGSFGGGGGGGDSTFTPPDGEGGAWVDVDCAVSMPARSVVRSAIDAARIIISILPHGYPHTPIVEREL